MAGTALVVSAVIGAGTAVKSSREQSKFRKQQRKLQKVRERRERNKLFAEQQRALGLAQVALGARGALDSSSGETVTGSIRTQQAGEQQFLTNVSRITSRANAFQANAQRITSVGSTLAKISGAAGTGFNEGLFSKKIKES